MPDIPDIPYCHHGDESLCLDLYRPSGAPRALVVFAHGGGFAEGTRRSAAAREIAAVATAHGLMLASVSYRLLTPMEAFCASDQALIRDNEQKTHDHGIQIRPGLIGPAYEAATRDISAAIAFCRGLVPAHDIASPRIGLIGLSAGGIAGLTLAHLDHDAPDLPPAYAREGRPDALFTISSAMVQPWRLGPHGAPTLMFNAARDRVIRIRNVHRAARRARDMNAPLKVVISNTRGHNTQVDTLLNGSCPDGRPYLRHLTDFFAKLQDRPKS